MQGYFSSRKAEDEGGLSPGEDDNAAGRKINRKDALDLGWFDYKIRAAQITELGGERRPGGDRRRPAKTGKDPAEFVFDMTKGP